MDNYIRDKFGKILSKDSFVAYVENGLLECGRIVEVIRIGMPASEIVRIERMFNGSPTGLLAVRPAKAVMKVLLPAT